jgi:hypothetical protein
LGHQSKEHSSPQTRGCLQQNTSLLVKRLTLLTQLLLNFTAGATLLPLGRSHVMARQSPQPSQQSTVISTTAGFAKDHGLSGDAGLKHPAPTP